MTETDFERGRDAIDPPLRTREELAYYDILVERLPGIDVGKTLGRFVEA